MSIEGYYIDCVRRRPIKSVSDTGRVLHSTYTDTNIKGYKGSQTDNLGVITDMKTLITTYNFYCNDFELKSTDLILYEGELYQVSSEPKNTVHKNHHIKVKINKIKEVTA